MKEQPIQYTLRVKGDIHQFMRTAYSEAEARRDAARFYLLKMGRSPQEEGFEAEVEDLAMNGLVVVYKR